MIIKHHLHKVQEQHNIDRVHENERTLASPIPKISPHIWYQLTHTAIFPEKTGKAQTLVDRTVIITKTCSAVFTTFRFTQTDIYKMRHHTKNTYQCNAKIMLTHLVICICIQEI